MKTNQTASLGIGAFIFLIFLTLKLANIGVVAGWSWWWVTSPLWIPFSITLIVLLIVFIIEAVKFIKKKKAIKKEFNIK